MHVEELDLPDQIIDFLADHDKIKQLYPPQADAVKKGLFDGRNLLVCIPTAAGKTLIGELAILKCTLERKRKAIYLAPLRALAAEKYEDFKRFEQLGLKVTITSGDYDSKDPWLDRYDVIVSTNEKMDALMRHGIEWLDQVGLLVVDEAHLIGERDRGPILEALLTKFRLQNPEAQVICLSATIRNTEMLAQWLDAELVESDWRPVTLKEAVAYDHVILHDDETRENIPKAYGDPLQDLVVSSLNEGGQVLLFCNSRRNSLTTARKISVIVHDRFMKHDKRKKNHLKKVVEEIRAQVGVLSVEIEELCQLLMRGVAYHNAGLPSVLRHVIEREFRAGNILALTATPTLSAGINLPARRVIITSLWRYQDGRMQLIPVMEYKQMAGRAGRPKYDPFGMAIILAANSRQADKFFSRYVHGDVEELQSKLNAEPALRRTVLSLISSQLIINYDALKRFMEQTFWGFTAVMNNLESEMLEKTLGRVLDFFEANEFISYDVADEVFIPLELGNRVSTLYLDPLSASMIIRGLKLAIKHDQEPSPLACLMLISITPDMIPLTIRKREMGRLEELTESHDDAFSLLEWMPSKYSLEWEQFLGFFKTAIVLYRWIEEHPPQHIIEDAQIGMGDLNRIVETATWLIHCAKELAFVLQKEDQNDAWNGMITLLSVLELRVQFGVKSDLLELIKIKGIGRVRARILYKNGMKSIKHLASADVNELAKLPGFGPTLARSLVEEARRHVNLTVEAREIMDSYHDPEPSDVVAAESAVETIMLEEIKLEPVIDGTHEEDSQFQLQLQPSQKKPVKSRSAAKRRRTTAPRKSRGNRRSSTSEDSFKTAAELLEDESISEELKDEARDLLGTHSNVRDGKSKLKKSKKKKKTVEDEQQQQQRSLDHYL